MKRKISVPLLVIATGLFLLSCAFLASQRTNLPDFIKGILFGVAIGVIALPLFVKKLR